MNRRRFLQTSAATIALPTIIPASALGGRGQRAAPSNRITTALIGCGSMGNANLNGFLEMEDVQVLAVCDPDRDRRVASKKIVDTKNGNDDCTLYNDYREILAREDIDTIIMATPDHWHALIVCDAAIAGKDIYGEKPLSLTLAEGRIMADTVQEYNRIFQTGSQQRSDRRFHRACELVRNGRIGKVHTVTCGLPTTPTTGDHPPIPVPDGFDYNRWLGPAPFKPYCENRTHWNFRWILDYSGGQVTDWGAHHIDIAHWGLGLTRTGPIRVEGKADWPMDGLYDAATNFDFTATYESGVNIRVTNKAKQGVKFEGEDGAWIFVSRGELDANPKWLLQDKIRPQEIRLRKQDGHAAHRREFIECCRTRRNPIAPIEEAHRTVSVAHLGNIAMQVGRAIEWNPYTEEFVGDDNFVPNRLKDRPMRWPYTLSGNARRVR